MECPRNQCLVGLFVRRSPSPVPQDAVKCLPKVPQGCGATKQARRLRVKPLPDHVIYVVRERNKHTNYNAF